MSMSPEEAAKLSRVRAPLKEAWMLAECVDADATVSQAGRPQIVLGLAPVEDNVPQRAVTLRAYYGVAQQGDTPQALGMLRSKGYGFLRAVDPNFPEYPKKVGQGIYRTSSGATVDYAGNLQEASKIDTSIFAKLDSLCSKDAVGALKGLRVFMKPQKAKVDDQGQVSQFIGKLAATLPDGDTYIQTDFIDNDRQTELLKELGI